MYSTNINVNKNTELHLLELRDADKLFSVIQKNRQHLRQWLPWLDINTQTKDSFDFIKRTQKQFADNQGFVMGIWDENEFVGVIGHNSIDWSQRISYPGYWLSKSAEGRGIMTMSCKALVDHAFDELKLNRVDIRCAVGNARSCAIPKRLGFTHEGVLRQAEWLYDKFVDHHIFGMLESDWAQHN